jgi:hypothetical protein
MASHAASENFTHPGNGILRRIAKYMIKWGVLVQKAIGTPCASIPPVS